ncbi:MAG: ABC transporter ATP-binding protein [Candidatus Edwardsbacteria bacterium]
MNVIKTEALSKEYKTHFWSKRATVLNNLNLEVEEGEIFGFLGPNGAGKTTTIKILLNIIYPTSGKAWLFEKDVKEAEIKKEVGFMPENPYFYEYLTAEEFLDFYGRLFGFSKKERQKKIEELLELVELKDVRDLPLRKFSRGMLQRIGIAQALMNNPKLVILDEPLSGLDPLGRKDIKDLILKLKKEGKTIFFSSHILPDAEMLCDRVGIIVKGKLLSVGRLDELLSAKVKSIELTVAGLKEEEIEKISPFASLLVKSGEKTLFNFDNEEKLQNAIQVVKSTEAQIISLAQQKESLEDYFSRRIKEEENVQN